MSLAIWCHDSAGEQFLRSSEIRLSIDWFRLGFSTRSLRNFWSFFPLGYGKIDFQGLKLNFWRKTRLHVPFPASFWLDFLCKRSTVALEAAKKPKNILRHCHRPVSCCFKRFWGKLRKIFYEHEQKWLSGSFWKAKKCRQRVNGARFLLFYGNLIKFQ